MDTILTKKNIASLCLAYILTVFGYEFIFFIMTVHIYELTSSPLNVSVFVVLSFIPKFFSPFYGALADRFSRKKLLAIAATATSGVIFWLSNTQDIIGIYALWLIISVFMMLISNIRSSLFVEALQYQNYHKGNSFMLFSSNGAKLLAPLLGGITAVAFQINGLFYAICIIYLLAAVLSLIIKGDSNIRQKEYPEKINNWKAGFSYIKRNPALRYLTGVSFLWRLFLGLQASILIIYVKTVFEGTNAQYGYFLTIMNLGSICGSLIGVWINGKLSRKNIIVTGLSLHYITFAALSLIRQFNLACGIAFFSYLAFYATLVSLHALRDSSTQSALRGRVYGTVTAIITFPALFSMLVSGYLCEKFSVNWVILFAGILAFISLIGISYQRSPEIGTETKENYPLVITK